jgi:hypothetical protein
MARSASAGAAGSLSTASSGSDLAPDRPANAASRARYGWMIFPAAARPPGEEHVPERSTTDRSA